MPSFSLEQFKNELEGNAQKRCAQQEKTIKEQAEMIKMLRQEKEDLLQRQKGLLAYKAIQEFCPFDDFFIVAFQHGVNFKFDREITNWSFVITATKNEREMVRVVKYMDIINTAQDLIQKIAREMFEEIIVEDF